jgi:glutamyl-tRNA synthetase
MLGFLFKTADQIVIEDDARAGLPENAAEIASAAAARLDGVSDTDFKTEHIQELLNALLIEEMQLKPRVAFGPLRTAISGRRISPPLFESMQILGKGETIARLRGFAASA